MAQISYPPIWHERSTTPTIRHTVRMLQYFLSVRCILHSCPSFQQAHDFVACWVIYLISLRIHFCVYLSACREISPQIPFILLSLFSTIFLGCIFFLFFLWGHFCSKSHPFPLISTVVSTKFLGNQDVNT